jgi:hypothetical protein
MDDVNKEVTETDPKTKKPVIMWRTLIMDKNMMENNISLQLVQRKLEARGSEVKQVKFHNINPLKVGNLNFMISLLRDLPILESIIFEDCALSNEIVLQIGDFVR